MHDLVESSEAAGDIVQSPRMGEAMLELRAFLFDARVRAGRHARREPTRADVVPSLFAWLCEHPEELAARPGDGDARDRASSTRSPA